MAKVIEADSSPDPEQNTLTLPDNVPSWLAPVLRKQPFSYETYLTVDQIEAALASLRIKRKHFRQHLTRRVDLSEDNSDIRFEITTLRRGRGPEVPMALVRGVVRAGSIDTMIIRGYSRCGLWPLAGYFAVIVSFVIIMIVSLVASGNISAASLRGFAMIVAILLLGQAFAYWRVTRDRADLIADIKMVLYGKTKRKRS